MNEFQTLKKFSVVENINGKIEYHFAIRTAMEFGSLTAMKFVKSYSKIIDVDYRNAKRKFSVFSSNEVFGKKSRKKM